MKILAFSGTSGSGKTTLAEALIKKYPNKIAICDEGTRAAAEELGFKSMPECPKDKFKRFEELLIHNHLKNISYNNKEILITDRSIFDIYVYTITAKEIPDEFKDYVYFLCKCFSEAKIYTEVIYFPMLKDVNLQDGFRSGNKYRYQMLDYVLRGIFDEFKINYFIMPVDTTVEDRINLFEYRYLNIGVRKI